MLLRFNFLIISILSIIYVIYLVITNKRRKRTLLEIGKSVIIYIYILIILKYTLFPIQAFNSAAHVAKTKIGFSMINYIPLRSLYWIFVKAYSYSMIMIILKPIILNIGISTPFGFLIQLFYHNVITPSSKLWFALSFGLCIEGLQLIISILIGYTYRVIDIDDIIFNAIGVLIGYQCYSGCCNVIEKIKSIKEN